MNPELRRRVFVAGVALSLSGFALILWCGRHFQAMVNYQRLAMVLPLMYGALMLHVDTLGNWPEASLNDRIRAIGIVFSAFLLTLATLGWLIFEPHAQAAP